MEINGSPASDSSPSGSVLYLLFVCTIKQIKSTLKSASIASRLSGFSGAGNQSLLLGVFVTKINVSSGIKIDDNLSLS